MSLIEAIVCINGTFVRRKVVFLASSFLNQFVVLLWKTHSCYVLLLLFWYISEHGLCTVVSSEQVTCYTAYVWPSLVLNKTLLEDQDMVYWSKSKSNFLWNTIKQQYVKQNTGNTSKSHTEITPRSDTVLVYRSVLRTLVDAKRMLHDITFLMRRDKIYIQLLISAYVSVVFRVRTHAFDWVI